MTSSRRWALAAACLLAAAAAGTDARAQPAGPSAGDLETARSLYKEGKDLRAQGNLRGALEKLRAAHALGHTPVTGIELARTYALLGKLVDAREVALSVARLPVATDETDKSAEARAEAAKLADELRPRIPTLIARPTGLAPGDVVHLEIDGAPVPDAALHEPQKVDPGQHEVALRVGVGPQERWARTFAQVAEGQSTEVPLDVPPPPEPRLGPPPPPPGAPHGGLSLIAKLGFGVGIAGGAVGAFAGITALTKASQLTGECNAQKQCDPSNGGSSDLGAAHSWATVSTVGFAIGVAGAAVGVLDLLLERPPAAEATAAGLTPWIGPTGAGVHGQF